MQCSGIHRSLGVHISKVRSATLGTWLPEQVAFIQSMGNEKSNSYWEAELPPNYDRVGIENFIRAKYEEKRWIARVGKPKSPTRGQEDKASVHWQRPGERSGHGHISSSENTYEERKITRPPSTIATRISLPVPPKGPEQIGTLLYVRVVKANPGMNPKLSCIDASGKAAEFGQLKDGYMFESSTGLSRMLLSSPTCPVLDALGKKLSFETAVGLNGRVWAQAKYLEQVLREFHAHPAIKGIIMWSAWKPRGCYQICLTNNNFTNLPAGDVVDKLLREWGSGLDGTTDAEGFFETSLSHGVYEVKITHPNVSINSSLAQSQRFEVSSADTSEQTTLHLQVST